MAPIYRTPGPWGPGKGSPLAADEVDENFYEHETRITAIEDNPVEPFQIQEIDVVGNQMTITLSDGITVFGPFTLPTAAFNWTGDWQPLTSYQPYDLFIASNGLYMALNAFTSGATFASTSDMQFIFAFPVVFDIGFFFPQRPGNNMPANSYMFSYLFLRDSFINTDAAGSLARLRIAPDLDLIMTIYYNGDAIGNITFLAGQTNGTFEMSAQQFSPGDFLRVRVPDPVDFLAMDLNVTFSARFGLL